MTQAIRCAIEGAVATITLDRPDSRNRLDAEALATLLAHLQDTAADPGVRVVVLTATGSAFCSGADLSGVVGSSEGAGAARGTRGFVDVLEAMLDHPRPIVGRIQGHVAGGGNGLVAACDIAVASQDARFAFTEVRVGVAPAIISVLCLARMRPRDAAELMLTGRRVTAERVREAGLVTSAVEADALDAEVSAIVDDLLAGGPEALATTKQLLRRIPGMDRDEAFAWAAELSAGLFTSAEAREGMTAFLEKRPAPWVPGQE